MDKIQKRAKCTKNTLKYVQIVRFLMYCFNLLFLYAVFCIYGKIKKVFPFYPKNFYHNVLLLIIWILGSIIFLMFMILFIKRCC